MRRSAPFAAALVASLWLPWFAVDRAAELGPAVVDGWEAFSRLDAALCAAGVLALLAPLLAPRAVSSAAACVCGAGAAALVAWKLVEAPVVPPLSTAAQQAGDFVTASGSRIGPYVALAAAVTLAAVAGLDAARARRAPAAWPSTASVVAGLTALAAVLRFAALGEQSYWYDEFATVQVVQPPLGQAVDAYLNTESTPPLYYALAWPWVQLLGPGEFALRSLSALFGTLTVPVVFLAGKRLVSARAGIAAAALVAVNPTLLWYSQEARAYALLVLVAAVTLLALARALREPTARSVALWALAAALALLTHYFAAFLVAAEGLVLAHRVLRTRPAALLPAALLGLVVAGLGLLAREQGSGGRTNWIGDIALGDRVSAVAKELVSANTWVINQNTAPPGDGPGLLGTAAVALALAGAAFVAVRRRRGGRGLLPLGLGAAALAIPLAATQAGADYFLDRNLLAAWPALAIGLGAALAMLPRWAGWPALLAAVAAGIAVDLDVATNPSLQRAAWRDGVAILGERAEGRAIVVTPTFAGGMLDFYGIDTAPLPAAGIRTRELAVIGNLSVAQGYPRIAGFAPVTERQLPHVGVAVLRAPAPVVVTPELAAASGVDPASIMIEPSGRARSWLQAYIAQLQGWRDALVALDAAAARGEVDTAAAAALAAAPEPGLAPPPADVPRAAATNALLEEAFARGARWARALSGDGGAALERAEAFDAALARVPGAAQALGGLSAVAITRELPR